MRRRRIHVSAHRAQSTLIIILEPHELSSSSHRAQSTLIKGLSSHQRTEEEDTCARRLASKDSPLIKGLSSNDSHPRALIIMCHRRRRIHVSDDSHQRALIIILQPYCR
jgi:hypothetical protein